MLLKIGNTTGMIVVDMGGYDRINFTNPVSTKELIQMMSNEPHIFPILSIPIETHMLE